MTTALTTKMHARTMRQFQAKYILVYFHICLGLLLIIILPLALQLHVLMCIARLPDAITHQDKAVHLHKDRQYYRTPKENYESKTTKTFTMKKKQNANGKASRVC